MSGGVGLGFVRIVGVSVLFFFLFIAVVCFPFRAVLYGFLYFSCNELS